MRARAALVTALLLVSTTLTFQVLAAEDLYWEGEEDVSNEFLEVKEENTGIVGHLHRLKRGFFDFLDLGTSSTSTTPPPTVDDTDQEQAPDDTDQHNDFSDSAFGSGSSDLPEESDSKEKTLRVTFVVNQPYSTEYSNRDSQQFKTISSSLADAVNQLFDSLPGTQRASLVRIQSRVSDEFTFKVTLDIVTTGYEDTDRIGTILREHIRNRRTLGPVVVSDVDFSTNVIDSGLYVCADDEISCDDGRCVHRLARCNGIQECSDGSDEADCTPVTEKIFHQPDTTPASEFLPVNRDQLRGDDYEPDIDIGGEDDGETTTAPSQPQSATCPNYELRCDDTRCVPLSRRCDGTNDCFDGADEADCEIETCGENDFRCDSGKCIESSRRCDRIVDCPTQEDEKDCVCRLDEFRCASDGFCIEARKHCDGVSHCSDNSDEVNCDVTSCPGYRCEEGSRTKCATLCDGRVECDNGDDEANCEECNHECDGRCLSDDQICNGEEDCRDGSDEQQCADCNGPADFRCGSGECLNVAQRCNNLMECSDASDEINCNGTVPSIPTCLENQFQCQDGTCINEEFRCDRHKDCNDNSDEDNCLCPEDEFQCTSGQCRPAYMRCDGVRQCDDGSDEYGCYDNDDETTPHPEPTTTTVPPPPPPYYTTTPDYSADPVLLKLKTYPESQSIRNENEGGDVVFQCRDEGPLRAPVRWVREDGRPLKPGSSDKKGRLEMYQVSVRDSGTYICQAPRYLGRPGSELRVQLHVESARFTTVRPVPECPPYKARCANGECISKSAVCDGRRDCSDGSDEDNCIPDNGLCEPNQFQCANRKCVLKTWLCDNENDCEDNSDEQNCGSGLPENGQCLAVEYKCNSGDQCVPKSFHCDGQSDCLDGSDEIGCAPVHITKPPSPANLRLNPGDTLTLICEAVGVPTPLISWRLNWGHVPATCTSTSERGIGTLTCHNMQPEHSGAYSCEAINNKGTTFAVPDSIVQVNRTDVCPNGFFNSEARSESECIRCFCFGESTQCRSADLFTYNMPTPLGEGGTRLVGVKQSYNGEIQLDTQPITEQYYYQPLRNGATVTKLASFGQGWGFGSNGAHPYLTLPETYNGNQLTSYGGHIKYRLAPHSPRYGSDDGLPDIIIKGKYESLIHRHRGDKSRESYVEARLTPENWQKTGPSGTRPATREDIMMALDNIDLILLRADLNNAGVNITDFSMESAQHINTGLGAANLVEECTCPPGYEGLSCQKCTSGYTREKSGPWLGNCVREQKVCPPGTYGDPSSGYGCRPCPCPLTNPENQFARTCSIGPSGGVVCDCAPGYGGQNCEYCEPGYVGNPMMPGDSCRVQPVSNCNPVGTLRSPLPDECQCKDNVQGRYCDQCKNDSFYLSEDFRHGCALCFCSGVSQQCMSSNLRRKTTVARFNTPQLVEQVRVYQSAPLGPAGNVKYNAPVETDLRPSLVRGEIMVNDYDRSRPSIYYWSLPVSFAGDKVTSYGGHLTYSLNNVPPYAAPSSRNSAADVQLISENRLTFHYFGNFVPASDGTLNASVQFLEKGWQRPDGKEISREHFLLALADVKAVLVKATYSSYAQFASLDSASIETAESNGNGPQALHVEQCVCPTGYVGTSCEDCAPGYTRSSSGLYLEHCGLCDCNGHSSSCHPETGVCYDCRDNTAGDNCELCKPGYEKNPYGACVPSSYDYTTHLPSCRCDPRGEAAPCDSRGYCQCKQNVEGDYCDQCRPGTFGLDRDDPLGCLACYCSGVTTDCHEAGHYSRIEMAAPILGENYGGYTLTDLNAEQVIKDQFVPDPTESELMYSFSFPPNEDLYWSLPVFPGNRLLSYGGKLSLTQKFDNGGYTDESTPGIDVIFVGDDISVYWTNPNSLISGQPLSYSVPIKENGWYILNSARPASRSEFMAVLKNLRRVLVRATLYRNILSTSIADVSMDTATENYNPAVSAAKGVEVCMCPEGYSGTSCESCAPGWYKDTSNTCRQCNCNGHECQLGSYNEVVCNCRHPYTGPDCSTVGGDSSVTSTRAPPPEPTVYVRITSPTIKIEEVGSSVNFTCQAQSRVTSSQLPIQWVKVGGELPQGRSQVNTRTGLLLITNLQISDSGKYICQTNDGISTAQAIATLRVPGNEMTLPVVQLRPTTNEYFEGERIVLECLATGNPAPRITWQRTSNYPLPRNSQSVEGMFIIENANEEDSGEYRCIANNAVGSTDRVAIVTVRPRPSWPTREKLIVSPTASNVNEGQSTRVVCTGTANVPAGSIDWIREDGVEFLANVRSDQGVLYIDTARPDNQGVYICQAASPEINPVPVLVTVIPLGTPPPSESPNIEVSKDRVKIPTGGSGSVDCIPVGYPQPLVRWKKYDGEFGPGTSQRDNTLIISNAQESDQGYYLCEGSVDGTVVANIYVAVEVERREAPRVEIWPQGEQAVALGSQFEFHCRVIGGVPEPDITWDRNGGRPLSRDTYIQKNNVLKFEKIEVNDEGEYTCVATNVAGTNSASAVLKVRSPPEIIITPNSFIEVANDDPVTIECRASGYPEPLVSIKSYKDNREVVPQAPGIAVLRIAAVSERDDGNYICTATSAAGTIEDQFVIRVDRGDRGDGGDFFDGGGSGEEEFNPPTNEPASLIAVAGEDKILGCNAPEGYRVQWRRTDNRPIRNSYQNGSILIIYNISKHDSGQYECLVINGLTNDVQTAAYTSVQVVAGPTITLQPKTQTVQPGQSPTVECIVDGDDIIQITWRANDRAPSRRVEMRGSSLIFHQIEVEDAGKYECYARSRYANASAVAEVIVSGPRYETPSLVVVDQPRRPFRVGENVQVRCTKGSPATQVNWERYGTNQQRQYVDSRTYGDGSVLVITGVQEADAGLYRCTGRDPYGRTAYEDFNLEVIPVTFNQNTPVNDRDVYTAQLGSSVTMPCRHDLEQPVVIEWRREYSPLPAEVRSDLPSIYIDGVTEADAGTYVCRISNSRAAIETRAILRVEGVVPRFDGESWIALPTIRDAFRQFDIEISFNPSNSDGLILYNSQYQGREGDYLALQLVNGVPEFSFDTSTGPIIVKGDRPLQLNEWHTIRLSRTNSKVTMDVDNTGPFLGESSQWDVLDLSQPLYIGGVPDYNQLPEQLSGASGFIGCVSMLILGREEKNIMLDAIEKQNINKCDACSPNPCLNGGVCQEARSEHGHICLCAAGFAGQYCDRTGDACRPGLCGPGKCIDTTDGHKCACPITYTGRNCDVKQQIEYPAFTGSAYLAINAPQTSRIFQMSMNIKPSSPVTDGIIMYCAESPRGYGGFTSLTVHNGKLEFRYDLGDGSTPVVITANQTLQPKWTNVYISRIAAAVSLKIDRQYVFDEKLESPHKVMRLETPMFVGGVDDSIILSNNTGVTGGFNGCIKEVTVYNKNVDIVNSSIQSANVQECNSYERGDIPETESTQRCNPSQCRNGGFCVPDSASCSCPPGFAGVYCESRVSRQRPYARDPCAASPCRNGGTCKFDRSSQMNYSCDCPLGYSGTNCQMTLPLLQSVGFNGNGYLELPSEKLRYDRIDVEPVVIALAFHTTSDGVLLYQREAISTPNYGDYILLRVNQGRLVLDLDLGSGLSSLTIDDVLVTDGERHEVIAKLTADNAVSLTVDRDHYKASQTTGLSNLMNADSNIYIGGIPERYNLQRYPGLTGCIEQVELMDSSRGLNLGDVAVAGRNTQYCRDSRSY